MNTASLDLRLLIVFNTLMSERSVSRVARKLSLSQPAVSNSLRRLRDVLGDELFHRSGDGMLPTPRAFELAAPVGQVLRQFEAVFQPPVFVPEESDRSFQLAVSPSVAFILLPALLKRFQKIAPAIGILTQSTPGTRASMLLDSQSVDMIVGAVPDAPDRFPRRVLYRDTYWGLMRTGHQLDRSSMTLKEFVGVDHLLMNHANLDINLFDSILSGQGLKRNSPQRVADWLTASEVIAHTDLVTTIFRRTGEELVRRSQGRLALRPLGLPSFEIIVFWHQMFGRHPAYEWLQDELATATAGFGDSAGH